MSVPNQKIITIHQSDQIPFLKIGIEELMEAYRTIKTPSSFVLYLYLASNQNGFRLELSKEAFANATGFSKSSYHRAVDQLTKLGYIYEDNGSLNFATTPKIGTRGVVQNWDQNEAKVERPIVKDETEESQNCNSTYSEMNTEINNKEEKEEQIKKDSPLHKDYSYLKNYVGEDGYYSWNGEEGFIDGNDPHFYSHPRSYQMKKALQTTPFDEGQLKNIFTEILR